MNLTEAENATVEDAHLIGVVPRANVYHRETGVTVVGSRYPAAWRWIVEGGGTLVLESMGDVRGPGHNAVLNDGGREWLVHHFYDAVARGTPTLQIRPLTWDAEGWPAAGEPVAAAEGSR